MLYRRYARELVPFLTKLTGSGSAAEDLVQNTFLSVWLNRVKLPEVENLNGYIYRIAANHAYTLVTKNKAIKRREQMVITGVEEGEDSTNQEILFREAQKLVREAISQLPMQRKKIFQMHKEGGLSYNEIAEQLEIAPSTVRNSVAAALETIRTKLTEAGLYVFFIIMGLEALL